MERRTYQQMYVDEIFSGLDYANFPKITGWKQMKVDEMVVRDTTDQHLVNTICYHRWQRRWPISRKDSVVSVKKLTVLQFLPSVRQARTSDGKFSLRYKRCWAPTWLFYRRAVHYCVKARHPRCNQCHDNDSSDCSTSQNTPRVSRQPS